MGENVTALLHPTAVQTALTELNAGLADPWIVRDGVLTKEFRLPDFTAAFAAMTRIAARAEAMNHHPDWTQNFGRLRVELRTHDAGGLTDLDFQLAAVVERCVAAS